MFTNFFYTCKAKGLDISLTEWIALHDAMNKNLCGSSLTGFYYTARAILVKSETDFDKFDMAFEECFKGIKTENTITDRMLEWLDKWEIPYDEIIYGKPWPGHHGFYVDDRAVRPDEFLSHDFDELMEICKESSYRR